MSEPDQPNGSPAACADDSKRLRELGELLRGEREERLRLEQVSEETKKLVHTLNNTLAIISAFAASLSDEVGADEPLREAVEEIARAAKRAAVATRKLGDLHRREPTGDPRGQDGA